MADEIVITTENPPAEPEIEQEIQPWLSALSELQTLFGQSLSEMRLSNERQEVTNNLLTSLVETQQTTITRLTDQISTSGAETLAAIALLTPTPLVVEQTETLPSDDSATESQESALPTEPVENQVEEAPPESPRRRRRAI